VRRLALGLGAVNRSRWTVPVCALLFGAFMPVVELVQGDPVAGVVLLAIMVGYGALLVAGSRGSETVSLLRGETPDERAAWIQLPRPS